MAAESPVQVRSWTDIIERARIRTAEQRPRALFVGGDDSATVIAVSKAEAAGLLEVNRIPTHATEELFDSLEQGTFDLIIYGSRRPIEVLRSLVSERSPFLIGGRAVSHVAVVEAKRYPKLLLLSDCAVTVQPDLTGKLRLIKNLCETANRIGIVHPRIAVLAAVEVVYPQMPVTQDAAILAKMAERGQLEGCELDGPLSLDVAIDPAAAAAKGVTASPVAGQADALLAPNIETAHGMYNAMALFGSAKVGAVVVGGKVPLVLPGPAEGEEGRFNSIALAALLANSSCS